MISLGLDGITIMVQDWGGPIGLSVAVRHPERFRALVIGNTWGWPAERDKPIERFSKLLGSDFPGGFLVKRLDVFTRVSCPVGSSGRSSPRQRRTCTCGPTRPRNRGVPVHVMPREILEARELLSEVEAGLPKLVDYPVLIVWGDRD